MRPLQVSAQFAAFVWFSGRGAGGPGDAGEAARFARANWAAFLPSAHQGLGRLLIRVGGLDRPKARRRAARRLPASSRR